MGCLAKQFRRWDSIVAVKGDSAVAGSSAEARVRENMMEATHAKVQGLDHTVILWDIASFYENITFDNMAEDAVKAEMPLTPLTLSLWSHMNARTITLKVGFQGDSFAQASRRQLGALHQHQLPGLLHCNRSKHR